MVPEHKNTTSRRKFKHLSAFERGKISALLDQGLTFRAIARELGRHPSTIAREIKRGTTTQLDTDLVAHQRYYPETGQAVYEKNRANCKRQLRIGQVTEFLNWAEDKMRDESWSPDVVVGYAQLHRLFKKEAMVCAKTLYSYIDRNLLKIRNIDLPLKTRRKPKRSRPPAKRTRGRSIDERPPSAEDRTEFGHWEIDTVQGKKSGDMALLTLTERKTRLHLLLPLRSCCAEEVDKAVKGLTTPLGSLLRQVFKTITADNGTEFSSLDRSGLEIYFSHPYSAWERGTNERHNGLTRRFIPKGKPIKSFSADHIRRAETLVNNLPRKILGYRTPLELFQEELSKLDATVKCFIERVSG
ncbi:MAG: IS30 family transposase [Limnochordia bacterium]